MDRISKYIVLLLITSACSIGCTPSGKNYQFDSELWKRDKNGCNGSRSEIYSEILKEKESLLKLNEKKIAGILGLPDANELSKRNQKFFIYTINPGRECKGYSETDELYLIVRFNAVGLSSEIFIQETPGPF